MKMGPSLQDIDVQPDPSAVAVRGAEDFVRLADKALRTGGRFTVALAGGSTPKRMYTLLTEAQLNWSAIHFFWGDERCVPPDHADSNYRMVAEALLDHIVIPLENIHRIRGELSAARAARVYAAELRRAFGTGLPHFDLILLGLGPDGHTASLFPNTPAVREVTCWTAAVRHRSPPPPCIDRVTLTLPVINAALNVTFLVIGADKADILARVLQNLPKPDLLPAQAVKPKEGCLRWLLDRSAAAGLASVTGSG
jgi:6-phosphogluconolactonase